MRTKKFMYFTVCYRLSFKEKTEAIYKELPELLEQLDNQPLTL
ncbi:MAG TPA: hypothetical protein VL053_13445 [Arachidicoccus sp.]|nr:hypothetical protein [Arachidicoccus sp.]